MVRVKIHGQEVDIEGVTKKDLDEMPAYQRVELGLTPHPLTPIQEFVDTGYLGKFKSLRKLFGLDKKVDLLAPFDLDQEGGGLGQAYSWYSSQMFFENDRLSIYRTVEEMDTYGIIASALDLYAEEATQPDMETGRTVWIESNSTDVKDELEKMFDRINLEDAICGIARTVAKYGDCYEQPIYDTREGVVAMEHVYAGRLSTIYDRYGRLRGFAPGIYTFEQMHDWDFLGKLSISKPWDFINFRISSSNRDSKHGETMLRAARYDWRQTKIMEDSLVLYRVNRAPDRMVYKIDTTGQTPDESFRTINKWRRMMRKKFFFDETTGKMRQEYHPWSVVDDIYWPTKEGSQSGVDRLSGAANTDDIHDVDHFRNKLFGDLRIPKGYMGFEGDIDGKTALTQQDIRFARTIKKLRRAIMSGVAHLCKIHLAAKGVADFDDEQVSFTVRMAPIAMLEELQRAEIVSLQLDQAERMLGLAEMMGLQGRDRVEWTRWVLVKYLGLTEDQVAGFLALQISGIQPDEAGGGGMGGMGGGAGLGTGPDLDLGAPADTNVPDVTAADLGLTGEEGGGGPVDDEEPSFEDTEEVFNVKNLRRDALASLLMDRADESPHVFHSREAKTRLSESFNQESFVIDKDIDNVDLYDLEGAIKDMRETLGFHAADGHQCPMSKCEGTLKVLEQRVVDSGSRRRLAICNECSFIAELEKSNA